MLCSHRSAQAARLHANRESPLEARAPLASGDTGRGDRAGHVAVARGVAERPRRWDLDAEDTPHFPARDGWYRKARGFDSLDGDRRAMPAR